MSEPTEKVVKLGIVREPGYLYFLKQGAVWRQQKPKDPARPPERIAELGVAQEFGYLYILDPDGDVARVMTEGKRIELTETAGGAPTTFADAFAPLRAHVGQRRSLQIGAGSRLAEGRHPITIFDWAAVGAEAREAFVEHQVFELTMARGAGWADRQVPFALIGGGSHPVDLAALDRQAGGVLLIDLASGTIMLCADARTSQARAIARSTAELVID